MKTGRGEIEIVKSTAEQETAAGVLTWWLVADAERSWCLIKAFGPTHASTLAVERGLLAEPIAVSCWEEIARINPPVWAIDQTFSGKDAKHAIERVFVFAREGA